jgi:hypothetical protein
MVLGMTNVLRVLMTHLLKTSRSVLIFSLCMAAFSVSAFAAKDDFKKDLYRKGMDAVNQGDAITARDAFCSLAIKDSGYADAATQCAMYVPVAQRVLNRYKINYAEGVTLLASNRYEEAELKLRNVRAGEYAEEAQKKLHEIPVLKAAHPATPETEFDRMLHIGDSGASFFALCDGNQLFEQYNKADQHTMQSLFCGGWVRGASQVLRLQVADAGTRDLCIPLTVTVGQQTRLLLQYIQKHPSEKDASASELFTKAMKNAYPCRILKNDPDAGLYESQ